MADVEDQFLLNSNSPMGQQELQEEIEERLQAELQEEIQYELQEEMEEAPLEEMSLEMDGMEAPPPAGPGGEVDEPLLLAAGSLAPSCGARHESCSGDCEACCWMERTLQSMELRLHFFLGKADDFQECLASGQEQDALPAAVLSFLNICQPYFNHLESIRSLCQHTPLSFDLYTRQRMLDFSQQLCDRLEQLLLTCASFNLLCLDEANPNSVSHFCVGQSQLGPLRVTAFRYCKPTPYLSQVDTGLFKRMRWNVERLRDEQQTDEEQQEDADTEYYFLCYEDIPLNAHAEAGRDGQDASPGPVVRMWSIGQWVQLTPDSDNINDWILCDVPQGDYHRLFFLGSDEPTSSSATDCLQQLLLLSLQTTE